MLAEALSLYDERFWDEEEGLSCDTWNTAFTVLDKYRGLNANMHTVEAFLASADVLKQEKAVDRMNGSTIYYMYSDEDVESLSETEDKDDEKISFNS